MHWSIGHYVGLNLPVKLPLGLNGGKLYSYCRKSVREDVEDTRDRTDETGPSGQVAPTGQPGQGREGKMSTTWQQGQEAELHDNATYLKYFLYAQK